MQEYWLVISWLLKRTRADPRAISPLLSNGIRTENYRDGALGLGGGVGGRGVGFCVLGISFVGCGDGVLVGRGGVVGICGVDGVAIFNFLSNCERVRILSTQNCYGVCAPRAGPSAGCLCSPLAMRNASSSSRAWNVPNEDSSGSGGGSAFAAFLPPPLEGSLSCPSM